MQSAADPGVLDTARDRDREHDEQRLHDEQHLYIAVERRHDRRPLQLDAGRSADEAPIRPCSLDDNRERDGGDREEDAAHPQRQQADAEAKQAADERSDRDLYTERGTERMGQKHRRIDTGAEEGVGTEIHVTRIAAENGPCNRENHELQDHIAGEEGILVANELRQQEHRGQKDRGAEPECDAATGHVHLPSSPCGRTVKTPSSSAKEIAGAQDAPNIVSTTDSATPRMRAAISVPVILPSPAITTTQKVRPI